MLRGCTLVQIEDLVLDDPVSYMPAQNKGKVVSRRKNTTGSIQVGLEVLEEEGGRSFGNSH